jgi:F0F1-type ATP synthase assembly protein I
MADPPRPSQKNRADQNLIGLGWQIAATLVIYTLGGYGLDLWLDTAPWLLLTGSVLGMIAVFVQIFRIAAELDPKKRVDHDDGAKPDTEHRTPNTD